MTARSAGVEQTRRIGAAVARLVGAGDVLLLTGDLGAGKTVFAQGFAVGLGIDDDVTSPTFALVAEHDGPSLRLLHADVYRLDEVAEVLDLGLDEQIDDGRTVALIEWGEKAAAALPGDHVALTIEADEDGGDGRTLSFALEGPSWEARRGRLIATLKTALVDEDDD